MGKKKARGNGEGDVYPRKDKDGKVVGYRGAYWVHTADGPRRRFVSGKTKTAARAALREAKAARDGGLVFDADALTLEEYLNRWLRDSVRGTVRQRTWERYEQIVRVHIGPTLGKVRLKSLTPRTYAPSIGRSWMRAPPPARSNMCIRPSARHLRTPSPTV